ncbi:protein ImuA [Meinhardsimonia xiamenensis]|jgi:protein ImuA|uniref:Protein ImuA n=1 Tax=Meinhardsimonia xiamenensis TaxID=990712 RepID=A0A1G9CRM5_9RHOB|nr:hypothetical protein [Meinhardsimonia xiamenensis]PRX38271.1 protein ImuA [Meinhardsimonia xiamenensis]SDK54278.1 protein ImuA [Meinhardsimonia xiamenensis]
MTVPTLSHGLSRSRPLLEVTGELALAKGRVHEFCGPARRTLAAVVAGRTAGPVLWIVPAWAPERLNPEALLRFFDPGRLMLVEPARGEDLLWCMEEALRAGAVALAVAELPAPPGLTPVRRLHLAAETGAGEGQAAPVGLILTPGAGGARGVESRWHAAPAHGPGDGDEGWTIERRLARAAPPARWRMVGRGGGFALTRMARGAAAPDIRRSEAAGHC